MRYVSIGDTFYFMFTTRQFSTGEPFTLAGGSVRAYADDSTSQITGGITLTRDFDGITGLNLVEVVAAGGSGFIAPSYTAFVLFGITATVDGVSVEGEVVHEVIFGTPPIAVAPADVAAIADAVWDEALAGHATAGSTGEALAAAGSAGDPWITPLPGAYGAGTAGQIVGDSLDATVSSRATQASVDTLATYVDTEVAAIKAKTDALPSDPADQSAVEAAIAAAAAGTAALIDAVPTAGETADAVWDEALAGHLTAGSTGEALSDAASAGGAPTAVDIADAVGAHVVEGTTTVDQSLRLANSANAGLVSGAATTNVKIRDLADTKDRIDATVDADGNRTAITRDVS